MRSKRILSLVLAFVMVLGTFGTVFAVDTTVEQDAAAFLKEAKVLLGDDEGELNLDLKLERRDMVVLLSRLMGEEEVALEFPTSEDSPTWEDVRSDLYYLPMLAWGQVNKYFAGKSETEFAPREAITAQDYAVVLLRALGYDMEGHDAWTTALAEAKALGILADVTAENATAITRGQMSVMTLNALGVLVKDSTKTLAETLEIVMPEPAIPTTLEVEEVVADNLKSFTVMFNQAVKSAEVKVKGSVVTLELAADKLSAVGYYTVKLDQSASAEFTINAETEAGLKLEDYKITKIVTDTVVPVALSAKALNPKQIELLFSEPVMLDEPNVKLLSDIKIDGVAVVAEASVNYFNNKVVLTLLAPMAEGTRELEVAKVKDFAGFVVPTAKFDLEVVKDETAPEAILAEVKNNKEIVVTFNEPLSKVALGTYTVDGSPVDSSSFVDNTNNTQVKLTVTTPLSIGATVEVKVGYKGQKDIMGNEVKETKYITTKVADDTSLPTVEFTKVESKNKVTLTFSKPMDITVGKYSVLDKDGKVFKQETAINPLGFNSDKTVLVFTGSDLGLNLADAAVYSIKLTEMKDASIRSNPLATATLTFTSVDTNAPTVDAGYKFEAATKETKKDVYENKITIYFSEAMDKATTESLANYTIPVLSGGNTVATPLHTLSAYTKAVASGDGRSVTITYVTETQVGSGAHTDSITVLKVVKDIAGNVLTGANVVPYSANPTLTISSAELVALNKITVTFNSNIDVVYPSLFRIEGSDNYFTSSVVNGTKVTFTSAANIDQTKEIKLLVNNDSLISNKYGDKLITEYFVVTDAVAPTLEKVEKVENDVIKFTFSEEIKVVGAAQLADLFNNLKVRNANGSVDNIPADFTVTAVYANTVVGATYAKVFTVHLSKDVNGLEVGFPIGSNLIFDVDSNTLKSTVWFTVK